MHHIAVHLKYLHVLNTQGLNVEEYSTDHEERRRIRSMQRHPNRAPGHTLCSLSIFGSSQKHPELDSHTNMELKILRISLLQNIFKIL